ncbi:hypothetical protein [Nocardioides convexus]|uniref:hypothetical protein n=1 Tax=Nocardioides convexus TaxID=2712224 RepID=UPI00241846FB|nr:hypothetical protein [Nocardioides convexus]
MADGAPFNIYYRILVGGDVRRVVLVGEGEHDQEDAPPGAPVDRLVGYYLDLSPEPGGRDQRCRLGGGRRVGRGPGHHRAGQGHLDAGLRARRRRGLRDAQVVVAQPQRQGARRRRPADPGRPRGPRQPPRSAPPARQPARRPHRPADHRGLSRVPPGHDRQWIPPPSSRPRRD